MRKTVSLLALVPLALFASSCTPDGPDPVPITPPQLAVVVVVDQLTPELLERYDGLWEGGFRTILDRGQSFPRAVHDHAITFTSPGHASPVTGVIPARHGIVGNSWREWRDGEWQSVSSVADPDTETIGGSGSGSSPHNLLVDGLPDWIVEAHDEARVVSLSGKSTAGVLMGGQAGGGRDALDRTHVYWFSTGAEGFVTSSWYRDELPDWVSGFNATVIDRFGSEPCWEDDLPPEWAEQSRRDEVEYESDGVHTHFPHCITDEPFRDAAHFISRTPRLDEATLALAREAVVDLELGARGAPDYLAIALSGTDRVGHEYGPFSREQLVNLVTLDRALGGFLEFLDETIGEERYVVGFTSDHGVLPLPEYLEERGDFGLRLTGELTEAYETAVARVGTETGPEHQGEEVEEARRQLAGLLEEVEWIEAGMTLEELASDAPADSFLTLYRNSFHPERLSTRQARWGVETRLTEGVLVRSSGTTHGVPYLHDRAVPLIFMGTGVPPGEMGGSARTLDLAPSMAELLGIPVPEGLDGRSILVR